MKEEQELLQAETSIEPGVVLSSIIASLASLYVCTKTVEGITLAIPQQAMLMAIGFLDGASGYKEADPAKSLDGNTLDLISDEAPTQVKQSIGELYTQMKEGWNQYNETLADPEKGIEEVLRTFPRGAMGAETKLLRKLAFRFKDGKGSISGQIIDKAGNVSAGMYAAQATGAQLAHNTGQYLGECLRYAVTSIGEARPELGFITSIGGEVISTIVNAAIYPAIIGHTLFVEVVNLGTSFLTVSMAGFYDGLLSDAPSKDMLQTASLEKAKKEFSKKADLSLVKRDFDRTYSDIEASIDSMDKDLRNKDVGIGNILKKNPFLVSRLQDVMMHDFLLRRDPNFLKVINRMKTSIWAVKGVTFNYTYRATRLVGRAFASVGMASFRYINKGANYKACYSLAKTLHEKAQKGTTDLSGYKDQVAKLFNIDFKSLSPSNIIKLLAASLKGLAKEHLSKAHYEEAKKYIKELDKLGRTDEENQYNSFLCDTGIKLKSETSLEKPLLIKIIRAASKILKESDMRKHAIADDGIAKELQNKVATLCKENAELIGNPKEFIAKFSKHMKAAIKQMKKTNPKLRASRIGENITISKTPERHEKPSFSDKLTLTRTTIVRGAK